MLITNKSSEILIPKQLTLKLGGGENWPIENQSSYISGTKPNQTKPQTRAQALNLSLWFVFRPI